MFIIVLFGTKESWKPSEPLAIGNPLNDGAASIKESYVAIKMTLQKYNY